LIVNSLIGLIGAFSLYLKRKVLQKLIFSFVSFAAGAILGGSLYQLLAESLKEMNVLQAINWLIVGFILFFILEIILKWYHSHKLRQKLRNFGYSIFIGDAVHNIADGLIITSTFLIDVNLGVTTTLLVIAHEVPQELGIFSSAVYGGIKIKKAIFLTFLSQASCILGGLLGYYFLSEEMILPMLSFAAGGFIYIAASDLIPELNKESNTKKSIITLLIFLIGFVFIVSIKLFLPG